MSDVDDAGKNIVTVSTVRLDGMTIALPNQSFLVANLEDSLATQKLAEGKLKALLENPEFAQDDNLILNSYAALNDGNVKMLDALRKFIETYTKLAVALDAQNKETTSMTAPDNSAGEEGDSLSEGFDGDSLSQNSKLG